MRRVDGVGLGFIGFRVGGSRLVLFGFADRVKT